MGQCASNDNQPNLHKFKLDKSKRGISFGLSSMRGKVLILFAGWRKYM